MFFSQRYSSTKFGDVTSNPIKSSQAPDCHLPLSIDSAVHWAVERMPWRSLEIHLFLVPWEKTNTDMKAHWQWHCHHGSSVNGSRWWMSMFLVFLLISIEHIWRKSLVTSGCYQSSVPDSTKSQPSHHCFVWRCLKIRTERRSCVITLFCLKILSL